MTRQGFVVGCYPGSFNPPTVAHLAMASAAVSACGLSRLDLVVSRVALGKSPPARPSFEDRVRVLSSVVAPRSSWLGLVVTDAQLLVDLAQGYDVLVLGADKWEQVLDASFYGGSVEGRDAAVRRLPRLAIAGRAGMALSSTLPAGTTVLALPADVAHASSTGVREDGRSDWMAPEAAAFDRVSGAWSDPARYDVWRATREAAVTNTSRPEPRPS